MLEVDAEVLVLEIDQVAIFVLLASDGTSIPESGGAALGDVVLMPAEANSIDREGGAPGGAKASWARRQRFVSSVGFVAFWREVQDSFSVRFASVRASMFVGLVTFSGFLSVREGIVS